MNKYIKTGVSYINLSSARTINVLPEDIDSFLELGGDETYNENNLGTELYINYADFESTVVLFDLKKDELQSRLESFLASDDSVLDLSPYFLDIHFSEDDQLDLEDECCGEEDCCGEEEYCDSKVECCGKDDCCGEEKHSHEHSHSHSHEHEDGTSHKHDHSHSHSHEHGHGSSHSHSH